MRLFEHLMFLVVPILLVLAVISASGGPPRPASDPAPRARSVGGTVATAWRGR